LLPDFYGNIRSYDERDGHYAFTNATIYTDYQTKTDNATLVIKKGKVVSVGVGASVPKGATEIDMTGKFIYPSFIDMHTDYGMPEVPKAKRGGKPQEHSKKDGAYSWNQRTRSIYT